MKEEELALIINEHKKWLLDGTTGRQADLTGADLTGADLSGANMTGANLSGADLTRADLTGADLSGANMTGADLTRADLTGADLSVADLSGTNLTRVDLWGANLTRADLSGADLGGANLDYSCVPLWCGSLSTHFDDRQIKQFLYHVVKCGLNSKNASEEVKTELTKMIELANQFHRAGECGRIEI